MADSIDPGFTVWGDDRVSYGPVELPALVSWVKDERVTPDTWVFTGKDSAWRRAADVPELQMFFHGKHPGNPGVAIAPTGLDPRALRRIKILAGMTGPQLERFAEFMEVEKVTQFSVVVRQGEPGEAMYFILEGEFRARTTIGGRETVLATLGIGDFFGDICLFDHGLRSADVVANTDGLLLRVTSSAFGQLTTEAPDVAASVLLGVGKTLSARIRTDNKRFGDSVKFARASS